MCFHEEFFLSNMELNQANIHKTIHKYYDFCE